MDRREAYRFQDNVTPLNADELNARFFDLNSRLSMLERLEVTWDAISKDVEETYLIRINEVLMPAFTKIAQVNELGFLIAPIAADSNAIFALGETAVTIAADRRELFYPSPWVFLTREDNPDDRVLAKRIAYDRATGGLTLEITNLWGTPGTYTDVYVSALAGDALSMIAASEGIQSVNGKTGTTITLNADDIARPGGGTIEAAFDDLELADLALIDAIALKEDAAKKGVANGYASLDATGKVPVAQVPNASRVGDLLKTTAGAPDANWLACDGAAYLSGAYPALEAIIGLVPKYDVWATRATTAAANRTMRQAAYLNGQWVGVGANISGDTWIGTSPDGDTWTERVEVSGSGQGGQFRVAYGNGNYVSVGKSGIGFYSTDNGVTWTQKTGIGTGDLPGLAFGAGLFVAGGASGALWTSPDGITWTDRTSGQPWSTSAVNDILWDGSNFYLLAAASLYVSSNGLTWSLVGTVPATAYGLAKNGNTIVIGAASGAYYVSFDVGVTWAVSGAFPSKVGSAIAYPFYYNGLWVFSFSTLYAFAYVSRDLISFEEVTLSATAAYRGGGGNNKLVLPGSSTFIVSEGVERLIPPRLSMPSEFSKYYIKAA